MLATWTVHTVTVILVKAVTVKVVTVIVVRVAGFIVTLVTVKATYLFTRLEESSLVPAGFLTAQFLHKT